LNRGGKRKGWGKGGQQQQQQQQQQQHVPPRALGSLGSVGNRSFAHGSIGGALAGGVQVNVSSLLREAKRLGLASSQAQWEYVRTIAVARGAVNVTGATANGIGSSNDDGSEYTNAYDTAYDKEAARSQRKNAGTRTTGLDTGPSYNPFSPPFLLPLLSCTRQTTTTTTTTSARSGGSNDGVSGQHMSVGLDTAHPDTVEAICPLGLSPALAAYSAEYWQHKLTQYTSSPVAGAPPSRYYW
jgi:hypothetical protein